MTYDRYYHLSLFLAAIVVVEVSSILYYSYDVCDVVEVSTLLVLRMIVMLLVVEQ